MSMTGLELVETVALALSDKDYTRWTKPTLQALANQAMRETVALVPRANTVEESVQLAAGTEQSIPDDAIAYIEAVRNMGSDGATPGDWIRTVDKVVKDSFAPAWPTATARTVVTEVMHDPDLPRTFWTYPPIPLDPEVWIALRVSKAPTAIVDGNEGDEIDLGLEYEEAAVLGTLARAYRINTDVASFTKAGEYRERFLRTLGRADLVTEAQGQRRKP